MGLLDWFTGKNRAITLAADRVWLSKQAKLAGMQREIAQALADPKGPDAIFLVAHFEDCLDELRAMAASARFEEGRVHVTQAETLTGLLPLPADCAGFRTALVMVGERHPLPCHNEFILEFARNLSCGVRVVYHVSLEDALLRGLMGEWVEAVLRKMGMAEDEAIESQLVARRLREAQKEIASRALGDAPARSAEKWLEQNCPPGGDRLFREHKKGAGPRSR